MRHAHLLAQLLILVFLLVLRGWKLEEAGLFDYDSVKNWLIVQEMASGNWQNFFHHASPSLFLAYLPFGLLSGDPAWLQWVSVAWNLLAVWLLVRTFADLLTLSPMEANGLLLFMGSSFFLVASARYVAMESWSLLLFAALLHEWHRLGTPWRMRNAFLLALLLTTNYKVLLLLPLLALAQLSRPSRGLLPKEKIEQVKFGGMLLIWPLLLVVLGMFNGLDVFAYPKFFYNQAIVKDMNPWAEVPLFRWDIGFYFQYLWVFEHPLVWLGMIWIGYPAWSSKGLQWGWKAVEQVAWWVGFGLLIGMSVLQKAPRGLLFAYPLLYCWAFRLFRAWLPPRVVMALLVLSTAMQVFRLHQGFYRYALPPFSAPEALAAPSEGLCPIYSTASLALAPYAPGCAVIPIFEEKAFSDKKGSLLLDDGVKTLNHQPFTALPTARRIQKWAAPELGCPLLWLELSEYTGLDFDQTMQRREEALRQGLSREWLQLE